LLRKQQIILGDYFFAATGILLFVVQMTNLGDQWLFCVGARAAT